MGKKRQQDPEGGSEGERGGSKGKGKLPKGRAAAVSDEEEAPELDMQGSEDEAKRCNHVKKFVRANNLRKTLPHAASTCHGCPNAEADKGVKKGKSAKAELKKTAGVGPVCVCLTCGHVGCDRSSPVKHAVVHSETQKHPVVYDAKTGSCWCYLCDDEVSIGDREELQVAVGIVTQAFAIESPWNTSGKKHNPIIKGAAATTAPAETSKKGKSMHSDKSKSAEAADDKLVVASKATISMLPGRVKGLSNVGNTCFFNAVMQNLAQTQPLVDYMNRPGDTQEDSLYRFYIREGSKQREVQSEGGLGPLTASLRGFLLGFRDGVGSNYNPSALFGEIVKKAPRFRGFQQQDSQELLRYLLDGMHTEELKRRKSAILQMYGIDPKAKPDMDKIEPWKKKVIKEAGADLDTFVSSIFGGQLVSTVTCLDCGMVSRTKDVFLDLSVPIPSESHTMKGGSARERFMAKRRAKKGGQTSTEAPSQPPTPSKLSKHQQKRVAEEKRKMARNVHRHKAGTNVTQPEPTEDKDGKGDSKEEGESKGNEDVDSGDEGGSDGEGHEVTDDQNNETNEGKDGDAGARNEGAPTSKVMDRQNGSGEMGSLTGMVEALSLEPNTEASPMDVDRAEMNNDSTNHTNTQCNETANTNEKVADTQEENVDKTERNKNQSRANEGVNEDGSNEGNENGNDTENNEQNVNGHDETTRTASITAILVKQNIVKDEGEEESGSQNDNSEKEQQEDETFQMFVKGVTNKTIVLDVTKNTTVEEIKRMALERERKVVLRPSHALQDSGSYDTNGVPTLAPMPTSASTDTSLTGCLSALCAVEKLDGENQFKCEECKRRLGSKTDVKVDATKQLLLAQVPRVLTLHVKRFEHMPAGLRKVNKHVSFPTTLDLAPFCWNECLLPSKQPATSSSVRYRLCGVVEHGGTLRAGHYVAYARARDGKGGDQWYYASDSHVSAVTEEKVLRAQAFLLFYELVE